MRRVAPVVVALAVVAAMAGSVEACGGGQPQPAPAPITTVWPGTAPPPTETASSAAPAPSASAAPSAPAAGCVTVPTDAAWSGDGTLMRQQGTFVLKLLRPVCWVGGAEATSRDAAGALLRVGAGKSDADASAMDSVMRAIVGHRVTVTGTLRETTASGAAATPPIYPLELTVETITSDGKQEWPRPAR